MKESTDGVYEILGQIGRGSYASVHKAINKQTGEICAIKKMPLTSELNNLIDEIVILSDCECKNIVRFLASACLDSEVSIVMEYCCGGSVKDVMRHLNITMTQEQITVIVRDVLNGLNYLHCKKKKIHRDVKAANILLNEEGIAKLGDFGVSEPLDTSTRNCAIIGTPLWLPPEVLNQDHNYGSAIDIWSLGITIIEMGDGNPPYGNLSEQAALSEIANMSKAAPSFKEPSNWPPILLDFLNQCLNKDASRRKSACELMGHELIKNSPSIKVIKDLVAEVCSNRHRSKELEPSLHQKSACLVKEIVILFNIYNKRRMKIIRVESVTGSYSSFVKESERLIDNWSRRDLRHNELKSRIKMLLNEICKLERERDELVTMLENQNKQTIEIGSKLEILRQRQNIELDRRLKLRSLEGKNS